jgi:hypothetical protein
MIFFLPKKLKKIQTNIKFDSLQEFNMKNKLNDLDRSLNYYVSKSIDFYTDKS